MIERIVDMLEDIGYWFSFILWKIQNSFNTFFDNQRKRKGGDWYTSRHDFYNLSILVTIRIPHPILKKLYFNIFLSRYYNDLISDTCIIDLSSKKWKCDSPNSGDYKICIHTTSCLYTGLCKALDIKTTDGKEELLRINLKDITHLSKVKDVYKTRYNVTDYNKVIISDCCDPCKKK